MAKDDQQQETVRIVAARQLIEFRRLGEQKLIFPDWSPKIFEGVPFVLIDPQGDRTPNAIMLHGTNGDKPPRMPASVTIPCNA
ncbi:MAG: hypothetical protein FJ267_15975, partial [Planctomycetes bacterium]|nr:hypothetical protein [Planctomycetota bacterium]